MRKGRGCKKCRARSRIGALTVLVRAVCLCCALFVSGSCASERRSVRIISWNVQTFFDAQTCGTEYKEFRASGGAWNREKYERRLENLCGFIKEHPADIYVFEEVENEAVLQDIANLCAGFSFFSQSRPQTVFAADEGGSLGIAVLSRLPIREAAVHQIGISALFDGEGALQRVSQPQLRPLLELHAESDGKPFVLFACHWKSKSGGAQKSELWRDVQEGLLARRIRDVLSAYPAAPLIVCGDFNRALEEFRIEENAATGKIVRFAYDLQAGQRQKALAEVRQAGAKQKGVEREHTDLLSAWFIGGGSGSYYFRETWEKIDHFFYNDFAFAPAFSVLDSGPHTQPGGIPFRYDLYKGTGYSDHLPLSFEFFTEQPKSTGR